MTLHDAEQAAKAVEQEIWAELSCRRWFGKHVEEEEMEELVLDIAAAIRDALAVYTRV